MHGEHILEGLEEENGKKMERIKIMKLYKKKQKKSLKIIIYPEIFTKIDMTHIKSDQVEIIQNKIFLL